MKIFLIMLPWLLAVSGPALGQTVNGPGDDVLCSGYAQPRLLTMDQWRSRPDQKFSAPLPLPQPYSGPAYSFRQVSQELKILADGTRICGVPFVHVSYNDSRGRRRDEHNFIVAGPDGKPVPTIVEIVDPVAGTEYYLDLIKHTAYRMHPPPFRPIPAGKRDVPNPAITEKNQSLGTHLFEGLSVEGNLLTTTGTPPGVTEPISATTETWTYRFANGTWPTVLLTKSINPDSERTNVLLQFNTAEPDPSLFRVSEGWNVVEGQLRLQP